VCPPHRTERISAVLETLTYASDVTVAAGVRRLPPGDLITADVPRHTVDELVELVAMAGDVAGVSVSLSPSESLVGSDGSRLDQTDDEAVVWAQVAHQVHRSGRLGWVNLLLVVIAAMIAAIGLLEDQLLLIVGAMALSPDYYLIAETCLAIALRWWSRLRAGLVAIAACFGAGIVGAWALTEVLYRTGVVRTDSVPTSHSLTLFVSQPNLTTVIVALLAGVAGALGLTLPDARGLVGVFVSITTIPAAANIGVAVAARSWSQMTGATVQLLVNLLSLLVASTVTLLVRARATGLAEWREVIRQRT
jgi:uncharacterized hydrophobic protein (TIGR00271 family)